MKVQDILKKAKGWVSSKFGAFKFCHSGVMTPDEQYQEEMSTTWDNSLSDNVLNLAGKVKDGAGNAAKSVADSCAKVVADAKLAMADVKSSIVATGDKIKSAGTAVKDKVKSVGSGLKSFGTWVKYLSVAIPAVVIVKFLRDRK